MIFAEIAFRVGCEALQVRSLKQIRVNLYRRTPPELIVRPRRFTQKPMHHLYLDKSRRSEDSGRIAGRGAVRSRKSISCCNQSCDQHAPGGVAMSAELGVCHNCNKQGHYEPNCPELQNREPDYPGLQ